MPLAPKEYDPARFDYETEASKEYARECAETAARIANDIQLVMSVAEEVARAWAADHLLDQTSEKRVFDADTHEWTRRKIRIDVNAAAARLAALIRETMQEALSVDGVEAQKVAAEQ